MATLTRLYAACAILSLLAPCIAAAAEEPTYAEKAILAAIAALEKSRDGADDALDQAKIDKAIRELEALVEVQPSTQPTPQPKSDDSDVEITTLALRAKFGGKPLYKDGQLTLTYDFAGKAQAGDFDLKDTGALVNKKALLLGGADAVKHVAKWKSFTVSAVMTHRGMRGVGVSSSNGSAMSTGGANPDTLYLGVAGGNGASKVVPDRIRRGSIPITFAVTPQRTTISYANEQLAQPTVRKEDVHQIILNGGSEGCAFSNLTITGEPDMVWLRDFLRPDVNATESKAPSE